MSGVTADNGIITAAIGIRLAGRLDRRVPEHHLQILHEHQEQPAHHSERDQQGHRSGGEESVVEHPDVEQRVLEAQLVEDEPDRRDRPDQQCSDGERGGPSGFRTLMDAEHQRTDRQRRQDGADRVEACFVCSWECGAATAVITSPIRATSTGRAKTQGHVSCRRPPRS